MIELRIASSHLDLLRKELLGAGVERAAVLFLTQGGRGRLLVREVLLPPPADYMYCDRVSAQLSPSFVAQVAKQAKADGCSLAFVHSHPGSSLPEFSAIDASGEAELADFLARRGISQTHLAMVVSEGGLRARVLGQPDEVATVSVGHIVRTEFDPRDPVEDAKLTHDRQIRAFGTEGQHAIQKLRVAVVGLGGTGSILVQQLVHLGVRDFVLVDPDTLEITNLNRVVGATSKDVGKAKVDVAKRYVRLFDQHAHVRTIQGDITRESCAQALTDVDAIFSCTDSHGSRSVLQQIAYQYLIPCIDMGSTITVSSAGVENIYGRVQYLSVGEPCLWCSGLLNSEQIRRDLMSEFERQSDPYIVGHHEPAPSVISLNATVVSLAITMFLGIVTHVPIGGRNLIYNARNSTVKPVAATAREKCFICSRTGVLARGINQQLYARQD